MPNVKSAIKRMNKSREQNARNRAKRSRLRTALKKVREATDAETAQARFREAQVLLDRAATSRLLHPNAVARMKSALARQVNSLG
ncbi:MAG: 30S ribosomal protein S20 [Gammaproteobacteria bacterium]|nr:30S ribosomal protein S20 [Gammaproteobacteria bacterium]MYD00084.1 30S ribosomal protein S20 [Gammaproteobacteria bacterium]